MADQFLKNNELKPRVETKPSNIRTKAVKRRQEVDKNMDVKLVKRKQALAEITNSSNQALVCKEVSKFTRNIRTSPSPHVKQTLNKKRIFPKNICPNSARSMSRKDRKKSLVKCHSLELFPENERKPKVKSHQLKKSLSISKGKARKKEVLVMPINILSWHYPQKDG